MKKIQSALISVYHKEGLLPVVEALSRLGVQIYSTGGTQKFLEKANIPVVSVESLTEYPSILGGRVKTLHPKVFGGILARRNHEPDMLEMKEYAIPEIDLVIVDLYPFEETVRSGSSEQEIIEKIDIGGIALIRAAAKNYADTLIVSHRNQYAQLVDLLNNKKGHTDISDRKNYAAEAFSISSHYDTAIFHHFNKTAQLPFLKKSEHQYQELRYGENPHQKGVFYGSLDEKFSQLHGKALSYNNLVDIDAAVCLIQEFTTPTFAILKHTNACGIASDTSILNAYHRALAGDPVSAFGGVLISNQEIEEDTAIEIHKLFCEVVIAPAFSEKALSVLKGKKNRILLEQKTFDIQPAQFKTILNGVLMQDYDQQMESVHSLKEVTKRSPSSQELEDLVFANKAVKHLKSNAIALVKNQQLIGMGCGQTSRVDALKQAIHKATSFGFNLSGSVMASDAFFPFPDCVEIANAEGITSIIQPGGSIKDQESIDACDKHNMSMVFSGIRHFKH